MSSNVVDEHSEMDNLLAVFRKQCALAEEAVEKYATRSVKVCEALKQHLKSESEQCDQIKQRLAEVEVECKLKKDACARRKEHLEATQQEIQSCVQELENLKVKDNSAVAALKEFDKEAYDSSVKTLRNQNRLASEIMNLELEQCPETGNLKAAVRHSDGKSEPFCVPTSGRDPCDIADELWNMLPL